MKYELEQTIYYLRENRIYSAPILTRMMVQNAHDDWAHTVEQKNTFQYFGETSVKYVTCHGVVNETEAFASKRELADSLLLECNDEE